MRDSESLIERIFSKMGRATSGVVRRGALYATTGTLALTGAGCGTQINFFPISIQNNLELDGRLIIEDKPQNLQDYKNSQVNSEYKAKI